MNKLPRSADCRPSGMIYLSCERRKSELRPVCLKIFARSVEHYFGIQSPAALSGGAVGPIMKLYKHIFRGGLHQFKLGM